MTSHLQTQGKARKQGFPAHGGRGGRKKEHKIKGQEERKERVKRERGWSGEVSGTNSDRSLRDQDTAAGDWKCRDGCLHSFVLVKA